MRCSPRSALPTRLPRAVFGTSFGSPMSFTCSGTIGLAVLADVKWYVAMPLRSCLTTPVNLSGTPLR